MFVQWTDEETALVVKCNIIVKVNDMNQLDTFYRIIAEKRANAVIPRSHGESIIKFVNIEQLLSSGTDIIKFSNTYLVCVFH